MSTKPMAKPMPRSDLEHAQLLRRTATRLAMARDALGSNHVLDKSNPPVNWGTKQVASKEISR